TFEEMDLGWGMTYYVSSLPEIPVQSILTMEAHDYAQVFIDDVYIGKTDRVKNEKSITLPPVKKGQKLAILVEAMGRINFGRAIKDFKGIIGDVTIDAKIDDNEVRWNIKKWTMTPISDDYSRAVKAFDTNKVERPLSDGFAKRENGRGYYRGFFTLKKVGDTFLNFETWGKGQVYVNGHAMGRIWSIGPQQTLYVPGCWLKKGKNEIIVLDVVGPKETVVWGQAEPELNKLQLAGPATHRLEGQKIDLSGYKPVKEGEFKPGNGWQEVRFDQPVTGRYVCIEALNSHWNREYACIAEWYMLDADGNRLSRESWTAAYADDEDVSSGNKNADKIFDLQESTYWSTNQGVQFPHHVVIDLGQDQTFGGFQYLPRAEEGAPESIRQYRIYVSSSLFKGL
ncbi:MAG: discoidin domain-containing protein, partial [Bacteroidales bacterium]|nr:discoidin domain-containing protein [Bacteroidales bacterium]